jgi:hypothetical protein
MSIPLCIPSSIGSHLARSNAWDVLALAAGLTTSDGVTGPGPVRAGALTAENVDVGSRALDGTLDVLDGEVGNWDTSGWGTSWGAVLVVLLDDDTVLSDAGEGDARVGDARDGTSSTVDGLDADTVLGVLDGGV